MSTQHTPGPWAISKLASPEYCPQFGIYAEGDPTDLAIVKNDAAEANARLIAAAPDMLAALEEVRAFYHGKTTSADEQRFMHKVWSSITKATAQ